MAANNDNMEVEEAVVELGSDGKAGDRIIDVDGPQSPIQSIQAGRPQKTTKCAYCRRDHKKVKPLGPLLWLLTMHSFQCVRTSDDAKCERCMNLNYGCFEAAVSSSPKRVFNRKKCDYCREAKQKVIRISNLESREADLEVLAGGSRLARYL